MRELGEGNGEGDLGVEEVGEGVKGGVAEGEEEGD